MRIIEVWQYKYIEKCLYTYYALKESALETEKTMCKAIESALQFFSGSPHEVMMVQFYFKADMYRKTQTTSGHYTWVCESLLHLEEPSGYVLRREIVYRVAMNCYALNLFQVPKPKPRLIISPAGV